MDEMKEDIAEKNMKFCAWHIVSIRWNVCARACVSVDVCSHTSAELQWAHGMGQDELLCFPFLWDKWFSAEALLTTLRPELRL